MCADSDAAIRALLDRYPAARDIEITGAGLEDAFLTLTGDADDDERRSPTRPWRRAMTRSAYTRYELLRTVRNGAC